MSGAGSVLILFIIVVRALLLHHLPKTAFLALWEITALRLLLPFSIPIQIGIPMNIAVLSDTGQALFAANTAASISGKPAQTTAFHTGTVNLSQAAAPQITWSLAVIIIWATGIAFLTFFFLKSYLRSLKKFRMSLPDDTPYIQAWLAEHQLVRRLEVRSSDFVSSPLTYGILHPVILLPKKLDRNDEAALHYILTHEYIHIRRFDSAAKIIFAIVCCIHWFNPLVWVMYILSSRDMELSCDAGVIRVMGEAGKASYALTLISMEEAKGVCSSICSHFSKNAITERIEAIMKFKKASALAIAVALVLVIGATSAFASAAVSVEDAEIAAVAIAGNGVVSTVDASALALESGEFDEVVIEGEVGDRYVVGDLIFEIVSEDEIDQVTSGSLTRASTRLWSITLSGDSMSKAFDVTASDPYAKVWIDNKGTGSIIFTITKKSPTGSVVSGSNVTIAAQTSISVYSTNKWSAATYYANFTSGKTDMVGTAACRVASTIDELDI